jgi:hypothetical protein
MIDQTPRQTSALALEETVCVEVERNDITVLLQRKPLAGMDLFAAPIRFESALTQPSNEILAENTASSVPRAEEQDFKGFPRAHYSEASVC